MSDSKHVYAVFTALFHPHMGGVETYTASLAGELARRGHRVLVVTMRLSRGDAAHEMRPDGVEVFRLPCLALMDGRLPMPVRNAEHAAMLDEVARAKPDRVVLNNHFYAHTLDGAAFAERIGAQAVVIEHGSAYLTLGNEVVDKAIRAYEHQMAKRVKSFGFAFAGVSAKACAWMRTFGIEARGVVPNALDARAYAASARTASFRDELGLGDDDLLIASVGRLVPEKGVEVLLEAARIVEAGGASSVGDGRRCLFAFAGDGPMLERVRFAGDNVVALGRLEPAEVSALLRDCDAYVLPSRSEGFATSLLESCAMGAFPVTTDVGGVAELGIGDVGGIVLPDASATSIVAALEVVSEQRELCAGQAEALQSRTERCATWSASADALENLFESGGEDGGRAAGGSARVVVEDYESDERLERLHRVLLMMLKDVAKICEDADVAWIANYGTAIGALRHGGFIPWDEDVDVCMLRDDLDRFCAAVQQDETWADKYLIVNAQTHAGYPLATTRLVLRGTEFRDSALATMSFPSGIFIDLFPLDALSDDDGQYRRQVYGSWFLNKLAIAKLTRNPYIVADGVLGTALGVASTAARIALNAPAIRAVDPNEAAYDLLVRYRGQDTRRVGYPCDTTPGMDLYEVDELFPVRWVPFEDMLVPLPHRAEELLTKLYGDWMSPPPPEARKAHYPDVLDFGGYGND